MLDAAVERAPAAGVREIVIGMAHRGRLNVLANTLRKPFEQIFNEFEDLYLPESTKDGDGDVKYHMGFSADVATTSGGSVHLSITPNPSHLEVVGPVVEGRVRAKQQHQKDHERSAGLPLLIHGDAAFAGQGVVAETLNLSNLAGYRTGGTLHVVVNNQIGFTTHPRDARSTQYCTDIAKFIQAPVFHVNGDDPEAAVYVTQLALDYRQQFKSDVVIDLVCYRKYGHNEGDEPSFTQPLEYAAIRAKRPVAAVYTDRLVAEGSITADEAAAIEADFKRRLDEALAQTKTEGPKPKKMVGFTARWQALSKEYSHDPVETAVTERVADRIADRLATVPDGFSLHPTVRKLADKRRDDIRGRRPLDWGTGEAVAFGSLVLEGHHVRLSGQDSRRGTFSHRHSWYVDQKTGRGFCPLTELDPQQAAFEVYDSSLSEMAVLAFEYGYSLEDPNSLVLWEGQFGDFANGAQVVIDQFIASGESKWNRSSGLVLLLPHGYEGQGPEHSSARLERFLQLCGEHNMQVGNFTTPANYFHALRRQVKRNFRKPLVVMTPKSLLRHKLAVSKAEEFQGDSHFRRILSDPNAPADENVRRLVLCSGKVAYDLMEARNAAGDTNTAIIRIEQLYPFPGEPLVVRLKRMVSLEEVVWAQEEPRNAGSWFFVDPFIEECLAEAGVGPTRARYAGRKAAAATATGLAKRHQAEQAALVADALGHSVREEIRRQRTGGTKPVTPPSS
jgi:2-oxoglutarate dehydrogenase E1 component